MTRESNLNPQTSSSMKKPPYNRLIALGAAAAGLAMVTAQPLTAQDDPAKVKLKEDKLKIKDDDLKVKVKGDDAEEVADELLSPEIQSTFVEGYVVPQEYRTHFHAMPDVDGDVELRYYGNQVYYVNPSTYEIVEVVSTPQPAPLADEDIDKVKVKDDKVKVKTDDGDKVKIKGDNAEEVAEELLTPEVQRTFVPGYIVPEEYRTYLRSMPSPSSDVIVSYHGNQVYYLEPDSYQIVQVIPLG